MWGKTLSHFPTALQWAPFGYRARFLGSGSSPSTDREMERNSKYLYGGWVLWILAAAEANWGFRAPFKFSHAFCGLVNIIAIHSVLLQWILEETSAQKAGNMVQAKRAGVWGTLGLKTVRCYLPQRSMGPSMWGSEAAVATQATGLRPSPSFSMASKAGEGWIQCVQCAQPLSRVCLLAAPL